jgi:hypothetical protein
MIPAHLLETRSYKIVQGGGYGDTRKRNNTTVTHMALDLSTSKPCRLMMPEAYESGLFFEFYRSYSMGWNYAPKIQICLRNSTGQRLINDYLHTSIDVTEDGSIFLTPVNEGSVARARGYWTGMHVHVSSSISDGNITKNIDPATLITRGEDLVNLLNGSKFNYVRKRYLNRLESILDKVIKR